MVDYIVNVIPTVYQVVVTQANTSITVLPPAQPVVQVTNQGVYSISGLEILYPQQFTAASVFPLNVGPSLSTGSNIVRVTIMITTAFSAGTGALCQIGTSSVPGQFMDIGDSNLAVIGKYQKEIFFSCITTTQPQINVILNGATNGVATCYLEVGHA